MEFCACGIIAAFDKAMTLYMGIIDLTSIGISYRLKKFPFSGLGGNIQRKTKATVSFSKEVFVCACT